MKKVNRELNDIMINNIYVDIQELKKIIDKWQSGEFYRYYYDQGKRGEQLYNFILSNIDYHIAYMSDKIIEDIEKKFGPETDINLSIHPKSDMRSIGFEILDLLEGWGWGNPERLTTEDIPAILEFLDTPPGKSLEAWDKWEQYWANLDYPERRKKLLDNAEE